jgi:hypothetical protein
MNASKLPALLYFFFLPEHIWGTVTQTAVELGYNITKGAEYLCCYK